MADDYKHLLSKHGVLVSFNIAKKIKQTYIKTLRKKLEKSGKSKSEIEREINKHIQKNTEKYIDEMDIPGLIAVEDGVPKLVINPKIQDDIIYLANKSAEFCKKNKFTKEHAIFFIQAVLHLLNVTNSDMELFKKKYNIDRYENLDDDYDGDDEDDDL